MLLGVNASSWGQSNPILCNQSAPVCVRVCTQHPRRQNRPGRSGRWFPLSEPIYKWCPSHNSYNVTTCGLGWSGFYASGKNEDVEKSHVSILLKRLYVFVSAWEGMVWLCASASHYTTPRSWPVSQSRDVTLTRCWPGSFCCLVPRSFLRCLWAESQLVCPRVRRNLCFRGLVCPPCGKLLLRPVCMWMFVNYMPSLLQLWIMGIVVPVVVRRQRPAQHQGSFSCPPRSPNLHPWERR